MFPLYKPDRSYIKSRFENFYLFIYKPNEYLLNLLNDASKNI